MPENDDPRTTDGASLTLDEFVERAEAAQAAYHAVQITRTSKMSRADREAISVYFTIERALNARVRRLVEEVAPALFDALERGTAEELAAAAERFRALPRCARLWTFSFHLDAVTRAARVDANEDFEPSAFLQAAIERRRLLAEGDDER